MKINAGNHTLTISEERCFDGKYHFYYCNIDNNPSEQIYTEELLENMDKKTILNLYENQNEVITV